MTGSKARRRLPAGRQPYDPLNGFRIGAVVGGLAGAIVAVATSIANVWLVLVGGAVGGAAGYWSQRKDLWRRPPD